MAPFFCRLIVLSALSQAQNAQAERSSGVVSGLALVQVKQGVEKVSAELLQRASERSALNTQAMASRAAAEMQVFLSDSNNVAGAMAVGIAAVHKAMPRFMADPPQVYEGFLEFGSGLFDAVSMMLPAETRSSSEFVAFQEVWDNTVETLPEALEDLDRGVKAYREEGDVAALMGVWSMVLDKLGHVVTSFLPSEVAAQVGKFLAAVEDALGGFDDAMEEFAEGNTVTAIQSVYSGIRSATDGLMPESVKNETAYGIVVGALDAVFKDLSTTVLEYQQRLLQSNVCWKDFAARESTRPSECPTGFHWDGEHWCYPGDGGASLLEGAVAGKRPKGAVPARCAQGSDYSEKRGAWCYKPCPFGTEVAGSRCKSACMGSYPINSPLMCGRSQGTIAAAIMEMTTRALKAAFNIGSVIQAAGDAGSMGGTVSSFVEAGKGFAHPKCPMLAGN